MRLLIYSSVFMVAFIAACSSTQSVNILEETNKSYYRLSAMGLKAFSCTVEEKDFNTYLNDYNSKPANEKTEKLPNGVRFHFKVNEAGIVTSELDIDGLSQHEIELMAENSRLLIEGLKGIIENVLGLWVEINFNTFFDSSKDYTIDTNPDGSRTVKVIDSASKEMATVRLTKYLEIEEILSEAPLPEAIFNPYFEKTSNGYLLNRYIVRDPNGNVIHEVSLDYIKKDGFKLLKLVKFYNPEGKLKNINFHFSNYQLFHSCPKAIGVAH